MITRMHHFGMMTDDLEKEIALYEAFGFTVFKRFTKTGMSAVMLFKGEAGIEFFKFDNPDGDQESMIKKHSAFVSDDLENDIQKYLEQGYKLAIPISEGTVVKRYAYIEDAVGNYIELLEPLET